MSYMSLADNVTYTILADTATNITDTGDSIWTLSCFLHPTGTIVAGLCGATMALVMFASSWPVVQYMMSTKSVGEYSFMPYLIQLANCSLWFTFAVCSFECAKAIQVGCNVLGFIVVSGTLAAYYTYCNPEQRAEAQKYFALINGLTWCFCIIVFIGGGPGAGVQNFLVNLNGKVCLILNLAMCGTPLISLHGALQSKSTEFIPVSLGASSLINSMFWFCFGLGIQDFNTYAVNACGMLCGAGQLGAYAYLNTMYPSSASQTARDVQMSDKNLASNA